MEALEYISIACPYCGQSNELTVERRGECESYSEDCQVCCRAMLVTIIPAGDEIGITVRREDD